MIPVVTAVRMTGARNRVDLPLLVLGPWLGASAAATWTDCARHLADDFDVVAWDLPGHGHNRAVPEEPFTVAELSAGVLRVVDDVLAERGELGRPFSYAGGSVGGAVGLQLLLDAPERVTSAVLLGTGARWADQGGPTATGSESSLEPGAAQVVAALATFDVRGRLLEIVARVLVVAGAADPVTRVTHLRAVASGVRRGRLVELAEVAHHAPVEAPEAVARLLRQHVLGADVDGADVDGAAGLDLDLRTVVEQVASGTVWSRPGLDRRSRSLVDLAAVAATGRHEALAPHLRTALAHGLTADEVTELVLQTAVHTGLAGGLRAMQVVRQVLAEDRPHDR